jgi:mRNA interferase HigB
LRIIARKTLRLFWEQHPDCEQPLKAWFREVQKANWSSINELRKDYPSASILKQNRIVFNIKGNKYRLIVKVNFEFQICWILFIGTHTAYDKLNMEKL